METRRTKEASLSGELGSVSDARGARTPAGPAAPPCLGGKRGEKMHRQRLLLFISLIIKPLTAIVLFPFSSIMA